MCMIYTISFALTVAFLLMSCKRHPSPTMLLYASWVLTIVIINCRTYHPTPTSCKEFSGVVAKYKGTTWRRNHSTKKPLNFLISFSPIYSMFMFANCCIKKDIKRSFQITSVAQLARDRNDLACITIMILIYDSDTKLQNILVKYHLVK